MLKITTSGGLTVADSFTPFNQADLDQFDIDFGSGGVMLLPTQSGPDPDEAISGGKDGNLYLANADNLGGYNATANDNLQTIAVGQSGAGIYSTPAYYNGSVYVNAQLRGLESFPVVNGRLTGPASARPSRWVSRSHAQHFRQWESGWNCLGARVFHQRHPPRLRRV